MSATPLLVPSARRIACCYRGLPAKTLEKTVFYRVVQQHLETSLAQVRAAEPDSDPVPPFVERDFRQYLECGILAHGNALIQDLTPYFLGRFKFPLPYPIPLLGQDTAGTVEIQGRAVHGMSMDLGSTREVV
jgi:hypothetical protein